MVTSEQRWLWKMKIQAEDRRQRATEEAQDAILRKLQEAYTATSEVLQKEYINKEMRHLEKRYGYKLGSWQREI